MSILDRALNVGEAKKFKQYEKRVELIGAFEPELEHDTDAELRARMDELRARAAAGESLDALLPECFAVVRETGKRTMGMRHFDVQLIGGMALHEGCIAEMKTGEGKTLTATLAVVLNSLAVRDKPAARRPAGPRVRRAERREPPRPSAMATARRRSAARRDPRARRARCPNARACTWSPSTTTSRAATRNG